MSDGVTPLELAELATRIRELLMLGLTLSPEVVGFIESTLPVSRPEELAALLADETAAECEPVISLLFFPEEELQIEIEEILAGRSLTCEDEQQLAERLARPLPQVSFDFPGGSGRLELEMTPARIQQFLTRLRLKRTLPKEVGDAIAAALAPSDGCRFRVFWRNARCPASAETVWFLCRLVHRADLWDRDGWACLAFLLEFLGEAGPATDLYRRLAARKALLLHALNRSQRQRAELARGNPETLMSRGMRLIALDEDETRRHVACIDRACRAVYGRIETIDIDPVPLYDSGTNDVWS